MPLSRHLEALAGDAEPPVLLACFQDARHFTTATAARFRRIAAHSPLVAALGAGLSTEPVPGVRGACLGDDRLRGERNVILVGPHRAAALVARDLGDDGPDAARRFEFALTHDRALVVAAARSMLRQNAPAGMPVLSLESKDTLFCLAIDNSLVHGGCETAMTLLTEDNRFSYKGYALHGNEVNQGASEHMTG